MRRLLKRIRRDDGQALVEFAFVLPLLLLLLFGIIDFGLAINQYNTNTNLANVTARQLSVIGTSTSANCGGTSYSAFVPWMKCEGSSVGLSQSQYGTGWTVCGMDQGTSGNSATTFTLGDPIKVEVNTPFAWLGLITNGDGYIGGIHPQTNITASATMRIEVASTSTFLSGNGNSANALTTCSS